MKTAKVYFIGLCVAASLVGCGTSTQPVLDDLGTRHRMAKVSLHTGGFLTEMTYVGQEQSDTTIQTQTISLLYLNTQDTDGTCYRYSGDTITFCSSHDVRIEGKTLFTGHVRTSGYAVLDTTNRLIRTFMLSVDSSMTGHDQPTFDSIPPFFTDRSWESQIDLKISDLPYKLSASGEIVVDTLVKILDEKAVEFQSRLKFTTIPREYPYTRWVNSIYGYSNVDRFLLKISEM